MDRIKRIKGNMKTYRFVIVLASIFCIASCTANLEMRKKQEEASRNLGETYMYQGNYTAALREFLKAEKLYAKDPYLQNDLGLVYMAKEKIDLAIDHFKKAVEIKPDYAPAKNNLGTAYLAQKNWDDAIACFKGITGDLLYATPHYPLSNLGWAYYNKKEYELAEKYYLDALKVDPGFVIALRGLGLTYLKTGKVSKAVIALKKAVKKAPQAAVLHFDLADAYTLARDYKRAIYSYEKVIELDREGPLANKAKKKLQKLR